VRSGAAPDLAPLTLHFPPVEHSSPPSYIQAVANSHDSEATRLGRAEPARLTCIECGKVAQGDASGWRAHLTDDDELATYCPECAEREVGDAESA
jgi:hypothetical protein